MKKKIIFMFIIIIVLLGGLLLFLNNKGKNNSNNNLIKVRVSEVAHSVFYAPQYLADSLGYFEDNGLDVDINLTAGADAVMASVLANEADIGFCGTEATIYVVDKIEKELFYFV